MKTTSMARMKMPRVGSTAKAWTEVSTPERTRKVPIRDNENARIASRMVQTFSAARFSITTAECSSAVPASQGISEAFSTGSRTRSHPSRVRNGPIRAASDAERQAHPGAEHPGPHPPRPRRVDASFEQGGDREGKCDREADIAEVEHRRVEGEARILQDWVEIAALERCVRNSQERIRRRQDEKVERSCDPGLHRQRIRFEHERQIGAENRDQRAEEGEDRHPQHHRAFMIAPDAGEPVDQWHRRIGILIDH